MARNWYGAKKIIKEDLYTRHTVSESDIRWEWIKGFIWLGFGYAYFHFIIAGWGI
jgi:hypothetical protein